MKQIFYFLLLSFFLYSCSGISTEDNIYTSVYKKLDKNVEEKKQELLEYMYLMEKAMDTINDHGPLIKSFESLNSLYCSYVYNEPLKDSDINIEELEEIIQETYLDRFMIFDNIYFINLKGDVFYTLKKEPPLMENIYEPKYIKSNLVQTLKKDPSSFIADFDIFTQNDPSAFFIYPVKNENSITGWCIFQFTADRLESIFSHADGLGMTGEVFMVNERDYLLTNSSFSPESSVLKLHLSNENISRKFELGSGHLEIVDYRGYAALTSFEVVNFHGLKWLIVSKIDKDEVLTKEFRSNPEMYYNRIRDKTKDRTIKISHLTRLPQDGEEVKLDQFKRIDKNGSLFTHGVSSCTVVLVTLPGTFTYMAHISAYDKLYGGKNTDIIGSILNRIQKYEIPDYLLRNIEIYIITPKIRFSENVLDYLTQRDILLSQIHIVKNHQAHWADVYTSQENTVSYVEWYIDSEKSFIEDLSSLDNVGQYIETDYARP